MSAATPRTENPQTQKRQLSISGNFTRTEEFQAFESRICLRQSPLKSRLWSALFNRFARQTSEGRKSKGDSTAGAG